VNEGIAFDDEYQFNPQQSSQWDGLRHHSAPSADGRRLWYGGTTPEEILDPKSNRIGLGFWAKRGIAGRGVLIDYLSWAERRGITVNALTQHVVSLDDILEIAKECKIEFQKADTFFLRVGLTKTWDAMTDAQKQAYSQLDPPKHAGIEQSERVVRFFWDNHFAAVASDAVSFEVFPAIQEEWDLHHHLLAGWGMPIGEMFDLEELATLCQKLGHWSFFISSSPLKFANGVSSPPNCMAIF
jgi:Putative cyclase